MGREDPRKIAAALVVLVLALGSFGFQIYRRVHPPPRALAAGLEAGSVVEAGATPDRPFLARTEGVPAPVEDLEHVLRRNPFLRPAAGGPAAAAGEDVVPALRPEWALTGIRTGPRPMAIIDDRTLGLGNTVRGWTVRSIARDRVTLENSDGRTLDLDLR